jgi:hypothetical protein
MSPFESRSSLVLLLAIGTTSSIGCGGSDPSGGRNHPNGGSSGGSTSAGGSSGGTTSGGSTGTAGGSDGTGATTSAGGNQSSTGGSAGDGGSSGNTSSGGGPIIPPPECEEGSTALPENAPALEPGVWKNITPSGGGISFGGEGNLTQGMTMVPCNPATLYLAVCAVGGSASYPKGVYRTTDAGTSWVRVLDTNSPNHIRVDPLNPLNLYVSDGVAGGTQGFYRTTDGGVTWDHKTNMCDAVGISSSCGLNDLYDVAADPTDFKHILISFHSPWSWGDYEAGAGILESTDAGDTWIPHEGSGWGQGHSIHFLYRPDLGIGDANTWLLGIQDGGGRYRTTNAGETWSKVSDIGIVHGGSTVYYTQDGTLYSAGNPGMVKSTDNGATWQSIANSPSSIGMTGDGEHLYGANLFGPTPMMTAPETDDDNWAPHEGGEFSHGPFEFAFDSANRILYAANTGAGIWALKLE